jgi:hypothetical protein
MVFAKLPRKKQAELAEKANTRVKARSNTARTR